MLLGRYCIENRNNPKVDFSLENEENIGKIKQRLKDIIPEEYKHYDRRTQERLRGDYVQVKY